jgi:glutathione reductase (NADPH)
LALVPRPQPLLSSAVPQVGKWQLLTQDLLEALARCAGRDPKKVLVGAAEAIDWVRRMKGRGIHAGDDRIDWPELMRFKRSFTDSVPKNSEQRFAKAGIQAFHGRARFISSSSIEVEGQMLDGRYVVIATGAKPMALNIPGEQYVTTSDRFLELEELPRRIVFIGGGYISFEFAHIAIRAGSEVAILHQGERPLERFDPELVTRLIRKTEGLGATVKVRRHVESIAKKSGHLTVHASAPDGEKEIFDADLVVHGAGRVPEIDDLNLGVAGVQAEERGIVVNEYLQSVSNPNVYAAGDAAATGLPALTPVAGYAGRIVASNLLKGNHRKFALAAVPTVVFTIPALAAVGLSEQAAQKRHIQYRMNDEDTSAWYSSRRVAEDCAGFKVLIEKDTDQIIGAHLIGPNAEELINIFALAMQAGIPACKLKHGLYGYPTAGSDLPYMV